MRNKIFFAVLLTLIVGSALFIGQSYLRDFVFAQSRTVQANIKGTVLRAEVAQTEAQRSRGLSGRATLGMDSAMLFIYSEPVKPVFWMKDMRFPIDMIFISKGKIVDIAQDMQPPVPEQAVQTYAPHVPIDWVLEVNAGLSDRKGWKAGDRVDVLTAK